MLPVPSSAKGKEDASLMDAPAPFPAPADAAPSAANGHTPGASSPGLANHPLAPLAGVFNDEPLWDDFLQAMQEYRQRVDEQAEAE